MSTALKFVILTHISSKVGYGHLNRCIVLGKEIKSTVKTDLKKIQATAWIFNVLIS